MPRRNLVWLFGIVMVSLFCWTIAQASLAPPRGPLQFVKGFPGSNLKDYERLDLFLDILQQVEQNYVHELTEEERRRFMEAAIKGGLQSLDIHSDYINPRAYKQFQRQSKGVFGGVGIQINLSRDSKRLTVISPIVGTPAYKAGIKPGDEIVKIDGQATEGMSQDDAVDKIQGPPGTKVVLTIRHRGSDREVDMPLTRSLIEVASVQGDERDANDQWDFMLDKQDRIGYVRLVQFNTKSKDELKAALQKLLAQNVRGLILDLRQNPGGLLEAAVEISDLFLAQGPIVSIEGRKGSGRREYDAHQAGTLFSDQPMVVLIDEWSASASEIVAAALQDHQRAIVIGERSFGKGSVQNLVEMEGGKSALKITTAKYLRPSGKNIHRFTESKEEDEWGVRPDVEVKLTPQEELEYWTSRRERDVVRDRGLSPEVVDKLDALADVARRSWSLGVTPTAMAATPVLWSSTPALVRAPRPFTDKVLDRALAYLREKLK